MNGKDVKADVAKSQLPQWRLAWLIIKYKNFNHHSQDLNLGCPKYEAWECGVTVNMHIISKLPFLTLSTQLVYCIASWHCDVLCLTVNYCFPTAWEGSTLTFWQWKVWACKEAIQLASVAFTPSATDSTMVLAFLQVITMVSLHFIQYFKTVNTTGVMHVLTSTLALITTYSSLP